jgi:hypothetical protein
MSSGMSAKAENAEKDQTGAVRFSNGRTIASSPSESNYNRKSVLCVLSAFLCVCVGF